MTSNIPQTTKQWTVEGFDGPSSLKFSEVPIPSLQDNEVLVQIKGATLNPRDLLITQGKYPWTVKPSIIPGSDGSGIVLATGPSVTRFSPGDRVITMLNQKHISGSLTRDIANFGTGASIDGTFREIGAFDEQALVAMPAHLSFVEAAALSCAGVTAWNALFGGAGRKESVGNGGWVLTQGTGSVSLSALQLAKAAGARVIATTSSPSKIPLLESLGADHVINYRETPHWGAHAKELTGGVGVDLVVEVAGPTTLRQSAESLKLDGQISVVGFIGGQGEREADVQGQVPSLLETWLNLYTARGVWVGSREQMEAMCRVVEKSGIRPVIDQRVFKLEELREAYEYLAEGGNVGKIGIEIQ
ncbi:zinc-binding dehydrogenase [Aspergillus carlsbadensis]|nr:zinc-binding dehydrogenase [Aspergillus carlsbadensis]